MKLLQIRQCGQGRDRNAKDVARPLAYFFPSFLLGQLLTLQQNVISQAGKSRRHRNPLKHQHAVRLAGICEDNQIL